MVKWRWWRKSRGDDFSGADPGMPTVEEAAEDGEAMAVQAALMSLKNEILVYAIKYDRSFDTGYYADVAKKIVGKLVAESHKGAERMQKEIQRAVKLRGKGRYSEDYRRGDLSNLKLRRDSMELVSVRLAEHAEDAEWIHEFILKAHRMAWAEISREMELSLDRTEKMEFGSENYPNVRDARVQDFIANDLAELIEQTQANRERGKPTVRTTAAKTSATKSSAANSSATKNSANNKTSHKKS